MPITGDIYHVPSDVVIENPNEGFDTVIATIDYILPANVERLILQGAVGMAMQGYGNTLDNELIGHDGTDLLNGKALTIWPAVRATTPTSSTILATSSSRTAVRGTTRFIHRSVQ